MREDARKPHLRAVPNVDADEQRVVVDREAAHVEPDEPVEHQREEIGETIAAAQQARAGGGAVVPAPVGLGQVDPRFGTAPRMLEHLAAVLVAGAVGGLIGGLAASSWRGAAIGAGANVSLLGLTASVLGGGRLSTGLRVSYAGLALGAAGLAGWFAWKRRR